MNQIHECTCKVLDEYLESKASDPLVIVSTSDSVGDVRNMVSLTLGPTRGSSEGWVTADQRTVSVRKISDPPKKGGGFNLSICCGGRAFTESEITDLRRWRDAAAG